LSARFRAASWTFEELSPLGLDPELANGHILSGLGKTAEPD